MSSRATHSGTTGAVEGSGRDISMRYQTVRTSSMTFEAAKIREWLKNQIPSNEDVTVLNACAGETKLTDELEATVIRNDINPDVASDLSVDVRNIGTHLPADSVDIVIHDPPYSKAQSSETYGTGETTRYGEETMSQFRQVLKSGGKLIQWAYSPQLHSGFEMEQAVLWNRIGRGHDYASTVQIYDPSMGVIPSVQSSESVDFNPEIDGVTGGANFGGNSGCEIEMSIAGSPDESVREQLFRALNRLKDGLTVIVTDQQRDYSEVRDRNTAVVSLAGDVEGDNYLSIRNISDQIPKGILDSVVIDASSDAFCWNTYHEVGTPWEETTDRTGYVTALKREVATLLGADGKLIQIGQTATNAPSGTDFVRTHVALTASADRIVSPFVTVDKRAPVDETLTASEDDTERLWPMGRLMNERTRPSHFRYTTEKEGLYRPPAIAVDCPTCGSRPGNLCISDTGEPIPHGNYHAKRSEKGEEAFYSTDPILPLREYIRGWIESTDPSRPKTAGGAGETPPAAQSNTDSTATEKETATDTGDSTDDTDTDPCVLTLADFQ